MVGTLGGFAGPMVCASVAFWCLGPWLPVIDPAPDLQAVEARIDVRMVSRAGTDPRVVAGATHDASSIFCRAGLTVRWLNSNERPEAMRLFLILDAAPASPFARNQETVGFAQYGHHESHRIAYAFVDRVRRLSRDEATPQRSLLAAVIAHELGHLLLPPGSHSTAGIMQADWDRPALRRIAQGTLLFTQEQALTMLNFVAGERSIRSVGAAMFVTSGRARMPESFHSRTPC